MKRDSYTIYKNIFFVVLIILVGILFFILSYVFAVNFFSEEANKNDLEIVNDTKKEITSDNQNFFKKNIFLIKEINGNEINIFNLKNGIESTIKISESQKNQFQIGDVINIFFKNGVAEKVEPNKNVWQKNRISNFKLDLETKKFAYENEKYSLSDNMFVKNNYDLNKISPVSLITIKGLGKQILYLEVNKGVGKINFLAKEKIINGTAKIDSQEIFNLNDVDVKELREGHHNIFISGDNIEDYSKDFFIKANEIVNLNLDEVEFKNGLLKINLEQSECLIYVDNKKILLSDPIFLNYGEHELKIIKQGFEDYINKIIIDSQAHEINVSLKKKVDLGKLVIITEPDDAEIYLDDAYVGKGSTEINVEYGKHVVRVKKENYVEIKLPLEINKRINNYKITLEPDLKQN